jgi:hypothetical protein
MVEIKRNVKFLRVPQKHPSRTSIIFVDRGSNDHILRCIKAKPWADPGVAAKLAIAPPQFIKSFYTYGWV